MLKIRELSICRGSGEQVYRIHLPALNLQKGDLIAVTGESGCGKSTLLEVIGLLLNPEYVEEFSLANHDLKKFICEVKLNELARIRAAHCGFVLQSGGLLPFLTVRQNIELPLNILNMKSSGDVIDFVIDALKLRKLLDRFPSSLSIGERQRVSFVRAIAHSPSLLLADEPTAALDPKTSKVLFETILKIIKELQLTAIIVSHDWRLVEEYKMPRLQASSTENGTLFELY